MRLGVFGGTFNPIHCGHIELVSHIIEYANLDKVFLIPTKIPPHKSAEGIADEEDRLEMCRLAVREKPRIEVSDIEIKRSGRSYTVDTLTSLKKIYSGAELFLIIGADMLLSFETWREWKKITALSTVCAVGRNGFGVDLLAKHAEEIGMNGERLILSDAEIMTVSSTEIRNRIKNRESIDGLVPKAVRDYIKEHGLYL